MLIQLSDFSMIKGTLVDLTFMYCCESVDHKWELWWTFQHTPRDKDMERYCIW